MCIRDRNTGTDRNTDYNHNIFNWAKISSITNVTVSETEDVALNLELDSPIDTTTTMLVSCLLYTSHEFCAGSTGSNACQNVILAFHLSGQFQTGFIAHRMIDKFPCVTHFL